MLVLLHAKGKDNSKGITGRPLLVHSFSLKMALLSVFLKTATPTKRSDPLWKTRCRERTAPKNSCCTTAKRWAGSTRKASAWSPPTTTRTRCGPSAVKWWPLTFRRQVGWFAAALPKSDCDSKLSSMKMESSSSLIFIFNYSSNCHCLTVYVVNLESRFH